MKSKHNQLTNTNYHKIRSKSREEPRALIQASLENFCPGIP